MTTLTTLQATDKMEDAVVDIGYLYADGVFVPAKPAETVV
jgi:hypothetical protein